MNRARKQTLGEARDEHDLEHAAACLAVARRRPCRIAAATARRRAPSAARPARPSLPRAHRADVRHRRKRGEDLDDALGLSEHAARERREAREPVAPRRARPAMSLISWMTGSANACSCVSVSRSRVCLSIAGSSGSSSASARMRARNSSASPSSRRCHRSAPPITAESTSSRSQRHGAGSVGASLPWQPRRRPVARTRRPAAPVRALRRPESPTCLHRVLRRRRRHLREREVFGESCRRQVLGGAREQRQKRAAGRIGPMRAVIEVRRESQRARSACSSRPT